MSNEEFVNSFNTFLTFCKKVLKSSKSSRFLKEVNRYKQLCQQTMDTDARIDQHKTYITPAYKECQAHMDTLDGFMSWMEKESSPLEIRPLNLNPKNQCRIRLRVIFRNCVRAASNVKESEDDPRAIYPEIFTLLLFRLFQSSMTTSNTALDDMCSELDELVGDVDVCGVSTGESTNEMDSIFDMAGDIVNEIGIDTDGKKLTSDDIKTQMTEFQNSGFKEQVVGMLRGLNLNKPEDMPQALGKLATQLSESAKEEPLAITESNNLDI